MDSSPDLSLKLRRGSSDSRDSFYLNLAQQGIDSDIEEVDNSNRPPLPGPILEQRNDDFGIGEIPPPCLDDISPPVDYAHVFKSDTDDSTAKLVHEYISEIQNQEGTSDDGQVTDKVDIPPTSPPPPIPPPLSPTDYEENIESIPVPAMYSSPPAHVVASPQTSIGSQSPPPTPPSVISSPRRSASLIGKQTAQSPPIQRKIDSPTLSIKSSSSLRQRSLESPSSIIQQTRSVESPSNETSQHSNGTPPRRSSVVSSSSTQIAQLTSTPPRRSSVQSSSSIQETPPPPRRASILSSSSDRETTPPQVESDISISSIPEVVPYSTITIQEKSPPIRIQSPELVESPASSSSVNEEVIARPCTPPYCSPPSFSQPPQRRSIQSPITGIYSPPRLVQSPMSMTPPHITSQVIASSNYQQRSIQSTGFISDTSTTSSPSPPPTPPPPPPLSIPPPPIDPLPPRHEPESPELPLSPLSISPPMPLMFHHHHHPYHNSSTQHTSFHPMDHIPSGYHNIPGLIRYPHSNLIISANETNQIDDEGQWQAISSPPGSNSISPDSPPQLPSSSSELEIMRAVASSRASISGPTRAQLYHPKQSVLVLETDDEGGDDDDDDDDDDPEERPPMYEIRIPPKKEEQPEPTVIVTEAEEEEQEEDEEEEEDEADEEEEEIEEAAESDEEIVIKEEEEVVDPDEILENMTEILESEPTLKYEEVHLKEEPTDYHQSPIKMEKSREVLAIEDIYSEIRGTIESPPKSFSSIESDNKHLPPPKPLPANLLSAGSESTVIELPGYQSAVSPITPQSPAQISSESVSHASSPSKSRKHSGSQHRVTIDESNLPLSTSSTHHQLVTIATGPPSSPGGSSRHSQNQLTAINLMDGGEGGGGGGGPSSGGNLALMYHSHHHYPMVPSIRKTPKVQYAESRYSSSSGGYYQAPEIKAGDALATTFSALYGKLLVVMGIAFPMAEVISTYIPPSFYEVYYLYLYIGSMLFLFFMYATILCGRPKIDSTPSKKNKKKSSNSSESSGSLEESDTSSSSSGSKRIKNNIQLRRPSLLSPLGGRHYHYGSFYLRMGAVAFGIGSMIYSGLEFGQYFELERDTKCHNVLLALTPATRMAFIFIQMYFIFLNNEQIKVYRHKIIARFGLMHMIGTNLSVWLNVLIQETKHEILTFYNPENRTLRISHRLGNKMQNLDHSAHIRVARGLKGPYQIFECRRTNIIGTLVQDASPFLFPCTIEYSLICAAILYVMWRSIAHPSNDNQQSQQPRIDAVHSPLKRSPHHYSVDCARAHKGLFVGILILVFAIISLILFFVLISRPEFVWLAVTEVTICELTIYATATLATVIGMIQVRVLQYDQSRSFQLDDILLVGAQTGLFLYSTFTVIGGQFTLRKDTLLVLITALASIVQTAVQTMFILDASRRQAVKPEHQRKKPGREIVTFMLVANLAMWAISTLEKSRAESHPIQLNFYGLWAWTIITHVSMPLAIFYRFHSTVCLCEIWKRAYKMKPTYM